MIKNVKNHKEHEKMITLNYEIGNIGNFCRMHFIMFMNQYFIFNWNFTSISELISSI